MKCLVTVERLPWALAVVALAMTAACSRPAEPAVPAAPPPTAPATAAVTPTPADSPSPEPEPSEAPTDPYAIPDVIDKAYVELVLEALGAVQAQIVQEIVRERAVTPRVRELLAATHGREAARDSARTLRRVLNRQGVKFFNANATAPDYTVRKLITAAADCIFAFTIVDSRSLVAKGKNRAIEEFYWLEHATEHVAGARKDNPTPWVIVGSRGPQPDGKEYKSPCA